jgi:hypothetical protein
MFWNYKYTNIEDAHYNLATTKRWWLIGDKVCCHIFERGQNISIIISFHMIQWRVLIGQENVVAFAIN